MDAHADGKLRVEVSARDDRPDVAVHPDRGRLEGAAAHAQQRRLAQDPRHVYLADVAADGQVAAVRGRGRHVAEHEIARAYLQLVQVPGDVEVRIVMVIAGGVVRADQAHVARHGQVRIRVVAGAAHVNEAQAAAHADVGVAHVVGELEGRAGVGSPEQVRADHDAAQAHRRRAAHGDPVIDRARREQLQRGVPDLTDHQVVVPALIGREGGGLLPEGRHGYESSRGGKDVHRRPKAFVHLNRHLLAEPRVENVPILGVHVIAYEEHT